MATRSILLCLLLAGSVARAEVKRYGRSIQLDGFLLEWKTSEARSWDSSRTWIWDATNTPEGVAGFFRSMGPAGCSTWVFAIDPTGDAGPWTIPVPSAARPRFANYQSHTDSTGAIAVEWVLPWDSLGLDSTGAYGFTIVGAGTCGDSLPLQLATGNKTKKPGILSPRLRFRFILIVSLIAVFVILQIRIGRQTARRGSLRR